LDILGKYQADLWWCFNLLGGDQAEAASVRRDYLFIGKFSGAAVMILSEPSISGRINQTVLYRAIVHNWCYTVRLD